MTKSLFEGKFKFLKSYTTEFAPHPFICLIQGILIPLHPFEKLPLCGKVKQTEITKSKFK